MYKIIKKITFLSLLIVLFFVMKCVYAKTNINKIDNIDLNVSSPSAILIEESTGSIIYEKNCTEKREPASMTKIMTMILVMEAIENKTLSLETKLCVSENASRMGGTTIYLSVGEEMTVEDLLKGVAITSANDAAVVFAEAISGSVSAFSDKMNEKAKEVGCINTNFVNPNGLPNDNHYSCAYDMALMGRYLVRNYPSILKYTSIYEDYLRKGTKNEFWLVNTNKLVRFYKEVDGLKTGWTNDAGYCLTATMEKDDIRFIAVAMGADDAGKRNHDIITMLYYGVNNYELYKIVKENDIIDSVSDIRYTPNNFNIVASEDIDYLKRKNGSNPNVTYEVKMSESFNKDNMGLFVVKVDGKTYKEIPIICSENVKKASLFKIIIELMKRTLL